MESLILLSLGFIEAMIVFEETGLALYQVRMIVYEIIQIDRRTEVLGCFLLK